MGLSGSAFAKEKSAEVVLYQASQVAGTTLPPGSYTVVMNATGSTADVIFRQNGKAVATVTGQTVQLTKRSPNTSLTVDNSGSAPTIAAIDFEGSQTEVSFSSQAATPSAGQ